MAACGVQQVFAELPFASGIAHQRYLRAEDAIAAASAAGLSHVLIDASLRTDFAPLWSKERVRGVVRKLAEAQLTPVVHGNFKNPLASDVEAIRLAAVKYAETEVRLAGHLGSPLILHAGCIVEPRRPAEARAHALDGFVRSVDSLVKYGLRFGVRLWLENLASYPRHHPFRYVFSDLSEIRYVVSKIGHDAQDLILDLGHAQVGGGEPRFLFDAFKSRVVALGISANDGRRDQHLPVGSHTRSLVHVMRGVLDSGWRGLIVLETRGESSQDAIVGLRALCGTARSCPSTRS